jgi:DNA adenine methylase
MGSKARIAKHILPIILKDRKPGQWYVEPFVGGANMIDKVDGNRIGADLNKYLIALLKEMSKENYSSPYITRRQFEAIKENKDQYDDWYVGFVGFQLSFSAMWFGSYRRDNQGERDYAAEAKRNVDKQSKNIKGIDFVNSSYEKLELPTSSVVYCDPPYKGTAKYKAVNDFDHDKFWQWCREKAREGHQVFISEYNAPDDFVCVWQQELNVSVAKEGKHKKAVEKLFVHKSRVESDYESLY